MSDNNSVVLELSSYNSHDLDSLILRIIKKCNVKGPIPLPTKRCHSSLLSGPHKHSISRFHAVIRNHRRIVIMNKENISMLYKDEHEIMMGGGFVKVKMRSLK